MRLENGLQRLAFLLGLIGAVLGGFASFRELQPVLLYKKFEALKASEVVQQEAHKYTADVQQERAHYFAREKWLDSQVSPINEKATSEETNRRNTRITQLAMEARGNAEETLQRLEKIERVHTDVSKGGIKAVHWTVDYRRDSIEESVPWPRHPDVESVETQSGESFSPEPRPAASAYFFIGLFPIVGFLIPWGGVHAIGWVRAGFARPSN